MTALLAHGAVERLAQLLELGGAADDRRVEAPRDRGRLEVDVDEAKRLDHALPFRVDRDRLDLHRVTHELARLCPDQHFAGRGRLLQPGSHVDGVAGDECVAVACDDLAGVDTDARAEPEGGDGRPHLPRSSNGAQRVILVGDRDAEHRHHRVADELLDGAAVPLEDRAHRLVVREHRRAQCLGVGASSERRRPGEVAEHDRDGLPDFARAPAARQAARRNCRRT